MAIYEATLEVVQAAVAATSEVAEVVVTSEEVEEVVSDLEAAVNLMPTEDLLVPERAITMLSS